MKNHGKEITLEEKQKCILDIYKKVLPILSETEHYFAYGSLLGAVRHKDFIPWDDDMDIIVPRKDYIKMVEKLEKEQAFLSENNLCLLGPGKVKNDYYKRLKIADTNTVMEEYGEERPAVFLDFFPIDYIHKNKFLQKIDVSVILFVSNVLTCCHAGASISNSGVKNKIYNFFIGLNKLTGNKLSVLCKKILISTSKKRKNSLVGCLEGEGLAKELNETSVYDKTVYLKFGDIDCPCPSGYDEILKRLYGDYMKLPPEEDRYNHSYYKMYWRE